MEGGKILIGYQLEPPNSIGDGALCPTDYKTSSLPPHDLPGTADVFLPIRISSNMHFFRYAFLPITQK